MVDLAGSGAFTLRFQNVFLESSALSKQAPWETQPLAKLMGRVLEAAAAMTPKEIATRAETERNKASGQWHEINAKESGLSGSKGASKDEFDRWEQQDMVAKAWHRVSDHALRREIEEHAATFRPVSPRQALEELGRYVPIAIKQLQAQRETASGQMEILSLQEGKTRRDAAILQRLGNEPLSISITPDQTPLDRVRAITAAVDKAVSLTPKDERFSAAEKATERATMIVGLAGIQKATNRLLGRVEPLPRTARSAERSR